MRREEGKGKRKEDEVIREGVHVPEGPAPAAVQTRAGREAAAGAHIAAVPACTPGAHWEMCSQEA